MQLLKEKEKKFGFWSGRIWAKFEAHWNIFFGGNCQEQEKPEPHPSLMAAQSDHGLQKSEGVPRSQA